MTAHAGSIGRIRVRLRRALSARALLQAPVTWLEAGACAHRWHGRQERQVALGTDRDLRLARSYFCCSRPPFAQHS